MIHSIFSCCQRSLLWKISLSLSVFLLSGCSSLNYLFQAGRGQLSLIQHARPISEVIQDEKTPPRIRDLLSQVPEIKKFGEQNGLKPTKNYIEYVKLDRSAAVWVVSACEKLRFQSKEWKFPIVGSFPYLGWFDLKGAQEFGAELKKQGWDVDVRGARAYSTLGWFRDAILSSMIPNGPEALGELINVILHESVHATLYVQGQAYFDESVASFIADQLTPQYLTQLKGSQSPELHSYLRENIDFEKYQKRMHDAYLKLNEIYLSQLVDSEKLAQKTRILTQLQADIKAKREITNATLIQYKEYHTGTQDFDALFTVCKKDWKRFLSSLALLNEKSFSRGQQEDLLPVLKPLIDRECPTVTRSH